MKSTLYCLALLAFLISSGHLPAAPLDLYLATGGRGSTDAPSGIYHATFDPAEGKLSAPKLAVQVQDPSSATTL